MHYLVSLQTCDQVIGTLADQLATTGKTLSILQMIVPRFPALNAVEFAYLDTAKSQMDNLEFVLNLAVGALATASQCKFITFKKAVQVISNN